MVLAGGAALGRLWPAAPVQAGARPGELGGAAPSPIMAAAFGGYAIPTDDGVLFGATFDRGDEAIDLRDADHAHNLALVAERLPVLAARLAQRPLDGRARLRAATADHMPLAGAVAEGLWALGGLGSRGFCMAPLLAEHVAALVLGRPSPLPADLAAAVDPLTVSRSSSATWRRARGRPVPAGGRG